MYQITQLPGGLRIATAAMPAMESVSIGAWVGVGGRHEPKRLAGISHYLEHMLFKGTYRRTAKEISQGVEGVGGYLNAFTGEENTCYYAKASHRYLDTLLDVLADMYQHPRLALAEVNKERQVIKEELRQYRDQPDHHVHEMLIEALWPNHPLGRSLTGTPESLDQIDRVALVDYKRQNYSGMNTIIAIAGHCEHEDVVARVRAALPLVAGGSKPRYAPVRDRQRATRLKFVTKDVEQTHLAIAMRGYSRHDRRRFALKLMSVILGENMSSRLFQVIREKYGLAYSIQTSTTYFADTGAFVVSAGLDTKRLPRTLQLVFQELRRMAAKGPAEEELRRAKDYSIGQMRLGLESTTNQMMWIGEHLMAYGYIHTIDEIEREIATVTTRAVREAAADVFRDHRLCAAVITPSKDEQRVRDLLHF
jgi:predicted Zn-dependent peptidase